MSPGLELFKTISSFGATTKFCVSLNNFYYVFMKVHITVAPKHRVMIYICASLVYKRLSMAQDIRNGNFSGHKHYINWCAVNDL